MNQANDNNNSFDVDSIKKLLEIVYFVSIGISFSFLL